MSEDTTAARAETVRLNETAQRISCTTDGFLVPSGELDCDLPVQQQDLGGLFRQVMSLFRSFVGKLRHRLTSVCFLCDFDILVERIRISIEYSFLLINAQETGKM